MHPSPRWNWAAAAVLAGIVGVAGFSWLKPESCPLHELAEEQQDGNDRFYFLAHEAIGEVKPHPDIALLERYQDIEREHREEAEEGRDAQFLLSEDFLAEMGDSFQRTGLKVTHELEINGEAFALLANER